MGIHYIIHRWIGKSKKRAAGSTQTTHRHQQPAADYVRLCTTITMQENEKNIVY
jgi:hypothetical protein